MTLKRRKAVMAAAPTAAIPTASWEVMDCMIVTQVELFDSNSVGGVAEAAEATEPTGAATATEARTLLS